MQQERASFEKCFPNAGEWIPGMEGKGGYRDPLQDSYWVGWLTRALILERKAK
jgi:hypothetical protein